MIDNDAHTTTCPNPQKLRAGKFSVHEAITSTRAVVDACVRVVQPSVPVPIEVAVDANVPAEVR